MIADRVLYRDGVRQPEGEGLDVHAAGGARDEATSGTDPGTFVHFALVDPSPQEVTRAAERLGLHPLAVEDALTARERVKVEKYERHVFALLRPLRHDADGVRVDGEFVLFAGDGFALTIERGDNGLTEGVREDLGDTALAAHGSLAVLLSALDRVVDSLTDAEEAYGDRIEELEAAVFSDDPGGGRSTDIYHAKAQIRAFRRTALPLAQPLRTMTSKESSPVTDTELRLRLRDVQDHLMQVVEHTESHDRTLADLLSVHLSQVSVGQNDDMRKISAWAAILAMATVVSGIYGMNFTSIPWLDAPYGFALSLGIMLALGVGLYVAFRRSRWL